MKELYDDIFYGRIYICDKCRLKNYNCTNRDCMKELERKQKKEKQKDEQISLF